MSSTLLALAQVALLLGDGDGPEALELRRGACAVLGTDTPAAAARGPARGWSSADGVLVRLVYEGGARAVIGPADRRSAHLAAQVCARAKGRFLLLLPWPSDVTLTRTGARGIVRMVHDDRAQAAALVGAAHAAGARDVALLVAAGDDEALAATAAFETAGARRITLPVDAAAQPATIAQASHADAVILLAAPDLAAHGVRLLRDAGYRGLVLGPLRLAVPRFLQFASSAADGMVLAAPPQPASPTATAFFAAYRVAHGVDPGVPAWYGHDAAMLLDQGLRVPAYGPVTIEARVLPMSGLTGPLSFDDTGNRLGPSPLSRVDGGRLRPLEEQGRSATK